MELRGVEPCLISFKTIGIKHFCVVRVHFKYNTAEAGRLIPTSAVLLHLAALLCQYSTARPVFRQVFSLLRLLGQQRTPRVGAADAVRRQTVRRLKGADGRNRRRAADPIRAIAAARIRRSIRSHGVIRSEREITQKSCPTGAPSSEAAF